MNIIKTEIEGVVIVELKVFGDNRGWFAETYSKEKFHQLGVMLNLSRITIHSRHKRESLGGFTSSSHQWRRPSL